MTRPSHEVKTITDVAKAAGVSRATVSRALNGSTAVSEDTRSHVQAVAKRLGYTINAQAQALATGRSNTIAILITEPIDELFDDPTFAVLIRGISEELCRRSFLPMILQASTPEEQRLALRHLESKAIDAVIDISPYTRSDLLRGLTKQPSPVVLCGQLERNPYEGVFSSVYSDDYEGGRIAGEAMARRGRRKVAIVLGPKDNPACDERLRGYQDTLGDAFDEDLVLYGGWDAASGHIGMNRLLDRDPHIDGVLAGSDRIALGILESLGASGRRVPEDVSLIGFDDHALAATSDPPLTTVRQPLFEEGEAAARLAVEMMGGSPAMSVVMHMRLIERQSL